MPELPEVETVRATLAPQLIGRAITRARLIRRDVAVAPGDPAGGFSRQRASAARSPRPPSRIRPADLLQGDRIATIDRRGKRLLIRGESGRAIGVHLGMTGQLLVVGPRSRLPDHTHATWNLLRLPPRSPGAAAEQPPDHPYLANGRPTRLIFRDPRRFGGLWLFRDPAAADAWLDQLGPDALTITARRLSRALASARRPVKAALLDQRLIAGVGNIYADEALHRAGIRPDRLGAEVAPEEAVRLAAAIRATLREAIGAGGSTLRDYTDAQGRPGRHQRDHRVYGRGGAPCLGCGRPLHSSRLTQRATVACLTCQR